MYYSLSSNTLSLPRRHSFFHRGLSAAAAAAAMRQSPPRRLLPPSEPLAPSPPPHHRVKLMCSYGGRILPRPHDHLLRYVGGESRIVSFPRSVSFSDFLSKLSHLLGSAASVKYQLPSQHLDSLISITCDEDLENMMEEYDKLQAPPVLRSLNAAPTHASSRLRLFLFPSKRIADLSFAAAHQVDALDGTSVFPGGNPFAISETSGRSPRGAQLDPLEEWASVTSYGSMRPQIYLPQPPRCHVNSKEEINHLEHPDLFGSLTDSRLTEQHYSASNEHVKPSASSIQEKENLVGTEIAYAGHRFDVTENLHTSEASPSNNAETEYASKEDENLIHRSLSELVANFGRTAGKPAEKKETFETATQEEAPSESSPLLPTSVPASMGRMMELKSPSFIGDPIFDEEVLLSDELDGKTSSTPAVIIPSASAPSRHLYPSMTLNQSVSGMVLFSSDKPKLKGTSDSKNNQDDAKGARDGGETPLEVSSQEVWEKVLHLKKSSQFPSATNDVQSTLPFADPVSHIWTPEQCMHGSKQDAVVVRFQKSSQIIPSRNTMPTSIDPVSHTLTARHEVSHGGDAKIVDPVHHGQHGGTYATNHSCMHVKEHAAIQGTRNVRDPQDLHHDSPTHRSALITSLDEIVEQSISEFMPVPFPGKKPSFLIAGQRSFPANTTRFPFSPDDDVGGPGITADTGVPYPDTPIPGASSTILHGKVLPVRSNPFVGDISSYRDQVIGGPHRNQQTKASSARSHRTTKSKQHHTGY